MKKLSVMGLLLLGCILFSSGAFAMHPELAVPEKVDVKNQACQEIMRIGKKYQVEGLFPKDFEDGKESCILSRLEVAVSLQLLTERLAEKAANEGGGAIAREDLELLSDLKEELRGEILLAHTRAFQLRYDELGTHLHALTKSITVSGGLTGVLQGSLGNRPKDYNDVVGRGDVVFSFKVGDSTTAVIDVEATGGNGIDARLPNFSVLNGVAGSTDDRVRFREAWVEHTAFSDRLIATIGKISLTNYFDSNAVANSENSQFLAGAFVNSAVLGAPANGPGVRVSAKLAEPLTLGVGYGSGDADSADILDHGFGIAELGYKLKSGQLEGNCHVYGSIDGALPDGSRKLVQKDAYGFGVSIDQQLTDKLTLFGRYGQHDKSAYATKSAWSVGGQYSGLIPARKDDILGFAFGQISVIGAAQEKLSEVYYKAKLSEQIAITPLVQYLINPEGNVDRHNVTVLGLRTQIVF